MEFFDLIASHFPGEAPDQTDRIPPKNVLRGIRRGLVALIPALKLFTVPKDLRRLGGKEGPEERVRSLSFARFLARRPDYAEQLDIPAETYQAIVDRQEAVEGVIMAVMIGNEAIEHASLLLQVSVSRRCRTVFDFVMAGFDDSAAVPAGRRVRDAFISLIQPACEAERSRPKKDPKE